MDALFKINVGPSLIRGVPPKKLGPPRKIEIRDPQYGPLSSHGSEVPVD